MSNSTEKSPITESDVQYLAGLAKLSIREGERAELVRQLQQILQYMEKLREVNTADIATTVHCIDIVDRDDIPVPSLPRAQVLGNASETDGEFFAVPRILPKSLL